MTRALTPDKLAEALGLLAEDSTLLPVAGCTDLMVGQEERLERPVAVLDLLRIPELRGIRESPGWLEIGSVTTFTQIRRSELVRRSFPALATAAAAIGGWQIQNRATLGGNMANASPAGDSLPCLLALDAEVVLARQGGERTIPYETFHVGYRRTALGPGEIIKTIRLPVPVPATYQGFRKVGTRQAQAISKVVVALVARVEKGVLADYRVAAGSVAPVPTRLARVEEAVLGLPAEAATADLAGRLAARGVEPIDDVRSTAAYRRFALERVVRRLTLQAM